MERGSTSFCHPSESASEITSSGRTCPKASYPNSLANGAGINPAATWAASLTWRSHAKHQLVSLKSSARRPALRLTNSLPSCVQKLVESETLMETKIGASIKMFDISYHRTTASVLAVGLGVLFLGLVQPARALPIDSTLFTTYESNGNTNITWVTCGSTTNTSGCYGGAP